MVRTRFIGAYMFDAEEAALTDIAYREGVSKSEALRIAIREAAQKRGLWKPTDEESYAIQFRYHRRARTGPEETHPQRPTLS